MPDTCLDTTRSQSLDVRVLRIANMLTCWGQKFHAHGWDKQRDEMNAARDELMDVVSQIRATIHRPSQQAHDLIQLLHRASSEGDAWAVLVDCATTIRGLSDADQVRVVSEALIAVARQREPGL